MNNELEQLLVEYQVLYLKYQKEVSLRVENEQFIIWFHNKPSWKRFLFGKKYIRVHIRRMYLKYGVCKVC